MKKIILAAFGVLTLAIRAELTAEQRTIPLEADSADPKLAKIILLAGGPSNKAGQHEYFAGCALMADWLKQNGAVWPVIAADGWPKDERIFEGARAVVVFADGGPKLPFLDAARWAKMESLIAKGTGFVMLHQAVDVPEANAPKIQEWLGGAWTKDIGCRGHWDMEFTPTVKHAILNGVEPFAAPLDGWLFNLHFAKGAEPILAGAVPDKARTTADAKANPGRAEVVAWAHTRADGGRAFAFTGCDLHKNWQVESQRRLVINGILWSANIDIPTTGAKVSMDPASLTKYWDAKPTPAPKPPTAPKPEAN